MIVASPPTTTTQEPQLYRISLRKYFEMAEAGFFDSDPRVELLEGVLVSKMTQNPLHAVAYSLLLKALGMTVPAKWHTRAQLPLVVGESCPEPDLAIV